MDHLISHGHNPDWRFDQTQDIQNLRQALQEFELGRFLLCNQGLNGYWTNYVLLYPQTGKLTGLAVTESLNRTGKMAVGKMSCFPGYPGAFPAFQTFNPEPIKIFDAFGIGSLWLDAGSSVT